LLSCVLSWTGRALIPPAFAPFGATGARGLGHWLCDCRRGGKLSATEQPVCAEPKEIVLRCRCAPAVYAPTWACSLLFLPLYARHFTGRSGLSDLVVDHSPDVHELENHRRLIRALGFPALHLPSIDLRNLPRESGIALHRPHIVLHLWAGGSLSRQREWPVDRWVALANHFAASGYDVCMSGAPAQHAANDAVIAMVDPRQRAQVHNAAGLRLAATATLLAHARLVVSVDTGVMHLAAALGVPVLGLCGPASSRRWGPVGAHASAIDSPLPGAGYAYLGFEMPRRPPPLMEAITLATVLAESVKMLRC
jgi:Glycosyltransferase family 9 (heptosyltransferase)